MAEYGVVTERRGKLIASPTGRERCCNAGKEQCISSPQHQITAASSDPMPDVLVEFDTLQTQIQRHIKHFNTGDELW